MGSGERDRYAVPMQGRTLEIDSHLPHNRPTVNQSYRTFPELALRPDHFSVSTRTRLSRFLVRALRGRRDASQSPLNQTIVDACNELRVAGLNDHDIVEFLGALVEEIGRACGADRPSLISGQLRWIPVQARVLELVRDVLYVAPPEALLAMDHLNGPR
jgi:hypothetical protein